MLVKRKSNIDNSSEKYVIITDSDSVDPSDNNSNGSNIVFLIRKRPRKLIIEDDKTVSIINYRSNGFGKKKITS